MIRSKKSLGQNFLKDKNIILKILSLIEISKKNILEIGPGMGALTDEIINLNPKKFIVIEKDKKLYEFLVKKYNNNKKIKIINEDIFNYDFKNLNDFTVISNMPYNISSKLILDLLIFNKNINEIVCMIQSELAEKFNYKKGKMNKYKFISKFLSNYKICFEVSNNVFRPKPKVKSKVVKFTLKKKKFNIIIFKFFIDNFFINKRKKIKSNKKFEKKIFSQFSEQRYEELQFDEILKIYKRFELFVS